MGLPLDIPGRVVRAGRVTADARYIRGCESAIHPGTSTTPTIDPSAGTAIHPATAGMRGTIDPSAAVTAPPVDPTACVGLGRRGKPNASNRRCNCRT